MSLINNDIGYSFLTDQSRVHCISDSESDKGVSVV